MEDNLKTLTTFVAEYSFNGRKGTVRFPAHNKEEAEARIKAMTESLSFSGEVVGTTSIPIGPRKEPETLFRPKPKSTPQP